MYILALDLETTGFDPTYNEIIQIGAILLDNKLNELGRFETLVKPEYPERGYRKEFNVYKYTGISEEQLQTADRPRRALMRLENFIIATSSMQTPKQLNQIVLLGQNTGFDHAFLNTAYRKFFGYEEAPFNHHCIAVDSAYFFFRMINNQPLTSPKELSLKEATKCLGVPLKKAHNAMQDVEATVEILRKLIYQS